MARLRMVSGLVMVSCTGALGASDAGPAPKPGEAGASGQLTLEPFFYPPDKAVLSVSFKKASAELKEAEVLAELALAGAEEALQSKVLNPNAARNEDEAEFSLAGLAPGEYELRVRAGAKAQRVLFRYPLGPLRPVVAPSKMAVGPLPPALAPPKYNLTVKAGGGLTVTVKGQVFRVESSYSYPHGGSQVMR